MINKPRKYFMDKYYKKPNKIDNYSSILNSDDFDNKYYLNMIENSNNNYDYGKDDNFISKLHSDFFNQEKIYDYSPTNNNFPIRKLKNTYYKNIYNINANTQTNSIKEFTLLDKSLSNLSLDKYRKMKSIKNFETEINDYQTIPNEVDSYPNKLLINSHNSFNPYYVNNRKDSEKKLYINQNYENNGDSLDFDRMKVIKNKNLKNKIRLNKEIINYNKLEKKINKKIEDSYKQKLLNNYELDYYTFNDSMKYKNEDNENKNKRYLINEYLLNSVKNNYLKSHKKLKRIKDDEDDISHQEKKMKRNTTFNYNHSKPKEKEKEKESENINTKFIKYLKKDNQKLVHINLIYKQLIDTFFYFVNQLAQKYSFKKELKNINYYINNANHLSNVLIDLEQHLNKMINSNDINCKNTEIENNEAINEQDQDKELLNKSKFISLNLENKVKQKPIFKTRNENHIKEFYSQNSKKGVSSKKIGNRTMQNNSLNFLNFADRNEIGLIKMKSKNNKNKKNNDRLIKMLNKISGGRVSPQKQKNLNNKISFKK